VDDIVVDGERRLRGALADVRTALVRFLRAHDFTVTSEQVSTVVAKRGSAFAGPIQPKKLPVQFRAVLTADGGSCRLAFRIGDGWRAGRPISAMHTPYRTVLADLEAALDAALARFTQLPTAGSIATTPQLVRPGGGPGPADASTGRAAAAPTPHKEVTLRSASGVALLDRIELEALLTVGLLVSRRPGSMPTNLARDVEALSAKLEGRTIAQPQGHLVVELAADEIPVVEFLARQAAIRQTLPLRTLHVCTTCKLEKVVNPDYTTLQQKNRRKQALTGAVGATISSRGVNPFVLVGSLMKLKDIGPPFVCGRCQGLDADSSVVTYCPNCGERRDEAVLRTCPRCKHSFTAVLANHELWHLDIAPAGSAALAAPSRPALGPPPTQVSAALPPRLPSDPDPRPAVPWPAPGQTGATWSARPAAPDLGPGWHADPSGRHQRRFFDGRSWTPQVVDDTGLPGHDPI
jgi:hypothetical protein